MPRPDPWVLAAAASLSVTLAVLVVFNAVMALRAWRVRRHSLDTLQDPDRQGQDSAAQEAMVRVRAAMDTVSYTHLTLPTNREV